jgi:flavin-dependent dehydrogenase
MTDKFDVVIAGAGPAGAVAAHVLARAGRRVLLVDDVKQHVKKVGESLPGAARSHLEQLGLLDVVECGSHLICQGIVSAWGSTDLAAIDLINDHHGAGWHLDRARFDQQLRERVLRNANVTFSPGRVEDASLTNEGWKITISNEEIGSRWLIDATGRAAQVARGLGMSRSRDDSLVALCSWMSEEHSYGPIRTLVESVPDGWWYTALLPGKTRVAVLHVDGENAPTILHTPGAWEAEIARTVHLRTLLEAAPRSGELRGVEACGARLDRFAGKGWLAIGDAALSFDPLSSQGLLNALYTGMKGANAVNSALNGELNGVAGYTARLENIRVAYLQRYRLVYAAEHRWPDHRFWSRRQRKF